MLLLNFIGVKIMVKYSFCNSDSICRRLPMLLQNRYNSFSKPDSLNIFDKTAKKYQKERCVDLPDVELYDYLKDNVGHSLSDRLLDVKRKFNLVVDFGCGRGYVSKYLPSEVVKNVIMCDVSQKILDSASIPEKSISVKQVVVDEEKLPFQANSIDLIISSLSLHWINDLPGIFKQIISCLKSDGIFMAAMFGGETLYELRCSLQLAQLEREGGISPHISPFTEVRDIGNLLTRAGFSMLTIDTDEIIIGYPSVFELMWDLKGMGENNAALNRCTHLRKETMFSAAAIYEKMYSKDGKLPATFQIINFIGWKPDVSQPQPLKRGSGKISMKDINKLNEIIKESGVELSDDTKK